MYNYNFNINFLRRKPMKKAALLMILPMLLTAGACTSRIGADQYDTSAVGEVNRAVKGTVVSVRQISIASNNGAGTLIGGAAGGVAGSMIGGSDTAHILGAIAGNAAQEGLSSQSGYEYVIQLDNGSMVTVSQGNDVLLNPGQKCMVLYGKRARVVPYYGN